MSTPAAPAAPGVDRAARRRSDARWALCAGACAVAAGVALVFVHSLGGADGDPEGWFAALGFAAPFVGSGLLAVLGTLVDAPWHWWAAGCALVACSIVSVVLFPVLLPAIALIVLGLRNSEGRARELWGVVLAVALIAAFAVVVFHQDPVTWDGGSSSNIVTTAEATLSITVTICVLVAGWALGSAPARRR